MVLDNRGFGCINRLQRATGGESFNNLLRTRATRRCPTSTSPPMPPASARSPRRSPGIGELEAALGRARGRDRTSVIVIDTDPLASTDAGGHWWDVAVPEVSTREEVRGARARYEAALDAQSLGD